MKQYKLNGWPELSPRFKTTAMHRVVSELTQRFASTRDLARTCGAPQRDIAELIERLARQGLLATRDAPRSVASAPVPWRNRWPIITVRGLLRTLRF